MGVVYENFVKQAVVMVVDMLIIIVFSLCLKKKHEPSTRYSVLTVIG